MKTITLKTQDDFFNQINEMALEEHISKSALIRKAITDYRKKNERAKNIKQMQDSARREVADGRMFKEMQVFDNALMDGLQEESLKGWVSDDIIKQTMDNLKLSKK
ncbi:MAG: hypothetical protein Ctma_1030 [Catillopecten margaritatus gill symbiont]|uniref:Ribbon-helix-helix protein CopG domain-containing protein n=1 Tax=Catillopecten margaritatus gill symbiont TaxID=3083288 RepID=A0AAU6PH07_9GAMM